jgi:hypothetical protein
MLMSEWVKFGRYADPSPEGQYGQTNASLLSLPCIC